MIQLFFLVLHFLPKIFLKHFMSENILSLHLAFDEQTFLDLFEIFLAFLILNAEKKIIPDFN